MILGIYTEVIMMSWLSLVSTLFVLVGLSLFLYGANVYSAAIGWTGFSLCLAGILIYVIAFLYVQLNKKSVQKTSLNPV
jgi:hypothetical protein